MKTVILQSWNVPITYYRLTNTCYSVIIHVTARIHSRYTNLFASFMKVTVFRANPPSDVCLKSHLLLHSHSVCLMTTITTAAGTF
jgi:hypothetical protein